MTATVLGIGPILGLAPDTVPEPLRDAYATSLLWSERVSHHADPDFASQGFYDGVAEEIGQIGWSVTDASTTDYRHEGEEATPSAVLAGIARSAMPAAALAPMTALMNRIEAGSTDGATGNFLTTWWRAVGTTADSTLFSTSPLIRDAQGGVSATLAFLDFGMTASSWQSFFAARVRTGTKITLVSRTITLNQALWRAVQPKIVQRLGQAALDDIATLRL